MVYMSNDYSSICISTLQKHKIQFIQQQVAIIGFEVILQCLGSSIISSFLKDSKTKVENLCLNISIQFAQNVKICKLYLLKL